MFVHGNTEDCNHWHEDYTRCLKWKNDKDIKAAVIKFILYYIYILA